jgi:GT2 family glycosyltransferase
MTAAPVSVVVVSRGRPGLLPRCLTGIGQLCYPNFEIVVVADDAGLAAVRAMGWDARVKQVPFAAANISAARNAGIGASAGDIVAFIDDDAVPEPTWLDHLVAPFEKADMSASGGYVIGRNGISFQWTARAVDATGRKIVLDHTSEAPFEPSPPEGYVAKLEGTNCAFRRDVLARLGGFDPAFRFYLDETDLNMRLAQSGGRTMVVPLARVHHGYAASERRAADRAPRDLTEIGASAAVFLRKHAPGANIEAQRRRLHAEHRRALLGYMVDGALEPRDVARLLAGFDAGFAEGLRRQIAPLPPLANPSAAFLAFQRRPASAQSRYFAGRPWNRARLRRMAAEAVAAGDIVTLFRFSPTALPHRLRFHEGGWWEQRGGLFGPSDRADPVFRLHGFRGRVHKEWAQVARLRRCRPEQEIS